MRNISPFERMLGGAEVGRGVDTYESFGLGKLSHQDSAGCASSALSQSPYHCRK